MSTRRQPRALYYLALLAAASLPWIAACGETFDFTPSGTAGGSPTGAASSLAGSSAGGAPPSAGSSTAGSITSAGESSAGTLNVDGGAATVAAATSGGASTTGGAPVAGGAAVGGSTSLESPPGFFSDGYLMRAPWMGYVYTIVDTLGSLVSPVCDATGCVPTWGAQACARGSVTKDPASQSFAGLAFHANDPMAGPRGTWTSTGTGIYVSVSNPPASARLQLQEEVASNDTRYCTPLPVGGTGLIPFASFKTYCWGDPAHPSKTFALGTNVHEVTVLVPGNSTAAQPFDFCLVDIHPA